MPASTTTIPGLDVIIVNCAPDVDQVPIGAVHIDGEPLVAHTVAEIALTQGLQQVVSVSARSLPLPPGVREIIDAKSTHNEIVAIASGVREFWHRAADATGIMCVNAPHAPQLLPELWAELGDADVAVATTSNGTRVPLCAVWNTQSLWKVYEFLGLDSGHKAATLLDGLTVVEVDGCGLERTYTSKNELAELGDVTIPDYC